MGDSNTGSTSKSDELKLQEAVDGFKLEDMINLALKSKHLEDICIKEWEKNPIYHTNLRNEFGLYPVKNKFFICKNAKNFHSLEIFTDEINEFNKATENIELSNLYRLHILETQKCDEMSKADFLTRCKFLEHVQISEPIAKFYLDSLLSLPNLKRLELRDHEKDEVDKTIWRMLVEAKTKSLFRVQTSIFNFRLWLQESKIEECKHLDGLILQMIELEEREGQPTPSLNSEMRGIESLRNLWFIGGAEHLTAVMAFVDKCPNLENFFSNHSEAVLKAQEGIIEKRRSSGNSTNLNLINCNRVGLVYMIKLDFI